MCCLTIYKSKDDTLIITHNRDEKISRQLSASEVRPNTINGKIVWMPKDVQSNGTWIATDGQMVAAILNGFKKNHVKKTTYRASRGGIIPAFFDHNGLDDFILNFNPSGYEPFTLILLDGIERLVEYGWDEHKKYVTELDQNAAVIYSSCTLYDNIVSSNRADLFSDFILHERNENDIWNLHATKGRDHNKFLNVDYNDEICTVALSQIILRKDSSFSYTPLPGNSITQKIKIS